MNDVPAGWYRDPAPENTDGRTQRYWDGHAWSQHARQQDGTVLAPQSSPYPPGTYEVPVGHFTPDGQSIAGWWQRVLATVVDYVIQIPLIILAATPSLAAHWSSITDWWHDPGNGGRTGLDTSGSVPTPHVLDPSTGPGLVMYGSVMAAVILYSAVFLLWKGATPGKLLVGLRVRRRDVPGPLPVGVVVRRVGFVAVLSAGSLVPGVGFVFSLLALLDVLWPLWDSKRQALHEKVAGTNVVLPT